MAISLEVTKSAKSFNSLFLGDKECKIIQQPLFYFYPSSSRCFLKLKGFAVDLVQHKKFSGI